MACGDQDTVERRCGCEKRETFPSPPVPQHVVESAARFQRLVAIGVFVHVPFSEAEEAPDPDYRFSRKADV